MKTTKRRIKWIALVILILIGLVGVWMIQSQPQANDSTNSPDGLNAYMSDKDRIKNELQVGSVTTEIIEDFSPPSELKPGASFTKNVKIKSTGAATCFVRVKAVFTDSDAEAWCSVDWNIYDAATNPAGWIYDAEDGFWYYPSPLTTGEQTTSLFTTIKVLETLSDGTVVTEAMMKDFDIIVYHESYQAIGPETSELFESYQNAWDHYHRNDPNNKT